MSKIWYYLKDNNFHSFLNFICTYNGQFFKMKVLNHFNQTGELPINIVAAYAETNGNKTRWLFLKCYPDTVQCAQSIDHRA